MRISGPLAVGTEGGELPGAGDPFVNEVVAKGEPDAAAPGACADAFSQAEPAEALGEGLRAMGGSE